METIISNLNVIKIEPMDSRDSLRGILKVNFQRGYRTSKVLTLPIKEYRKELYVDYDYKDFDYSSFPLSLDLKEEILRRVLKVLGAILE